MYVSNRTSEVAFARGDGDMRLTEAEPLSACVRVVRSERAKHRGKIQARTRLQLNLIREEFDWLASAHIEVLGTVIG